MRCEEDSKAVGERLCKAIGQWPVARELPAPPVAAGEAAPGREELARRLRRLVPRAAAAQAPKAGASA